MSVRLTDMKITQIICFVAFFTISVAAGTDSVVARKYRVSIDANRYAQLGFPECWISMRLYDQDDRGKYVEFSKYSEFKKFVSELHTGSEISWDVGCIMPSFPKCDGTEIGDEPVLPLGSERINVEEVEKFCRKHGVNFSFYWGW